MDSARRPVPPASMTIYRFGGYTLDLARGSLHDGAIETRLRPKSFDVLCCFVKNTGRLLGKEELMEAAWPGIFVSDDSLVQCVHEIRRALNNEAQQWLKTVPGRGYLFDAPVTVAPPAAARTQDAPLPHDTDDPGRLAIETAPTQAANLAAGGDAGGGTGSARARLHAARRRVGALSAKTKVIAAALLVLIGAVGVSWWVISTRPSPAPLAMPRAAPPPPLSMIVLPFANLSGDPGQDYIADALAEDITAALSRKPGTFVISSGSAATFKGKPVEMKEIGRDLGVRYVVLGGVRRSGEEMRLNVELVETENGRQLWSERLDYPRTDQSQAQSHIVTRIAEMVGIETVASESRRSLRERPDNPEAADLVMRGRFLVNGPQSQEKFEQARTLFEAALQIDENNVMALVLLARIHVDAVLDEWVAKDERPERLDRAEQALDRAFAIDPTNPIQFCLRGAVLRARGEPEQALAAHKMAIELDPNFAGCYVAVGRVLVDLGRAAEGLGYVERAIQLGPRHPASDWWYFVAGRAALYSGNDEVAVGWLRKAIEVNPGYRQPRGYLAAAYALLGREAEARQVLEEHYRRFPGKPVGGFDKVYPHSNAAYLAQRERITKALRGLGAPEPE